MSVRYDITPLDPEAHLFMVGITVSSPTPSEQFFRLPSWIAGSYLIRDFAGNVMHEEAYIADRPVPVEKVDKCTWRVPTVGRKEGEDLFFYYRFWAYDASVRGNYLDDRRGFFNPGALFMQALGQDDGPVTVNIVQADESLRDCNPDWKVATALMRKKGTERFGWGLYEAPDYRSLLDCPVMLGDFDLITFKAHGTRHDLAVSDAPVNCDFARLRDDLQKICEAEIAFFEPETKKAPFKEYVFLLQVMSDNYGGLEHAASCALIAPRKTLPSLAVKTPTEDYTTLLTLFSHEYFHAWCVKRITPAEFVGMSFEKEVNTELLWLFEGFTSYYDNLIVRRAGLIDVKAYAALLTRDLKAVLETPARLEQSLAEASFDTWIKFYKPTANRVNSSVSYYKQGALAALVLDCAVREKTKGKKSLDDVMRSLWADCRQARRHYAGISMDSLYETFAEATGTDLARLLDELVYGKGSFDYAKAVAALGIELKEGKADKVRAMLGIEGRGSEAGFTVRSVFDGEIAQWVGIAPGDTLIAIDGMRIKGDNLNELLSRYREGDEMVIHAFRDDRLCTWIVLTAKSPSVKSEADLSSLSKLGKQWLKG